MFIDRDCWSLTESVNLVTLKKKFLGAPKALLIFYLLFITCMLQPIIIIWIHIY